MVNDIINAILSNEDMALSMSSCMREDEKPTIIRNVIHEQTRVLNLEDMEPENDMLHIKKNMENNYSGKNMYNETNTEDKFAKLVNEKEIAYKNYVGKIYRHFKGHIYKITNVVVNTETLELLMIYVRLDGNSIDRKIEWSRPMKMFFEPVDKNKYPDVDQEMRFQEV